LDDIRNLIPAESAENVEEVASENEPVLDEENDIPF
jgi:hypothetical protein